jgi:hypothetical protein
MDFDTILGMDHFEADWPADLPPPNKRCKAAFNPHPDLLEADKGEQIWRFFFPQAQTPLIAMQSSLSRIERILARPAPAEVACRLQQDQPVCTNYDCGNRDASKFVVDHQSADVICAECGLVAVSSKMHEGALAEHEDKAPRNHHGMAANPWLSSTDNLSTMMPSLPGAERAIQEVGRTCGLVNEDMSTTEAYKDRQKREVFRLMGNCASNLRLPNSVLELAKQRFFELRARLEKLQKLHECVAGCLVASWNEVVHEQQSCRRGPTMMPVPVAWEPRAHISPLGGPLAARPARPAGVQRRRKKQLMGSADAMAASLQRRLAKRAGLGLGMRC